MNDVHVSCFSGAVHVMFCSYPWLSGTVDNKQTTKHVKQQQRIFVLISDFGVKETLDDFQAIIRVFQV